MDVKSFNIGNMPIDPNMARNSIGILISVVFKLQSFGYSNDEVLTFLEVMFKTPMTPDVKNALMFDSLVTYLHAQSKDFNDMLAKLHELTDEK